MTEDEVRAIVEQQHQLDELAKHSGWHVLEDYALHGPGGSLARQTRLVNGNASDFDDYLRETGFLRGVHHVLDARKAAAKFAQTAREALALDKASEEEA